MDRTNEQPMLEDTHATGQTANRQGKPKLDRRIHAFRDDLADLSLKGKVDAPRFTSGEPARVVVPSTPLRRAPRPGGPLDTELLFGEEVMVFEKADGWAWVQAKQDGYVGYISCAAIGGTGLAPTHRMNALRGYIFPKPDLKTPPIGILHFGSQITVVGMEGSYAALSEGGFVFSDYLRPVDSVETDPAELAKTFLNTPYLWGGRTSHGLDCSALVQLSWQACGITPPRDSDMLFSSFGEPIEFTGDESVLRKGDLVFWKGHVGIWLDEDHFLHSNASDMMVAMAPLSKTADRIAEKYEGPITGVRRPPTSPTGT